MNFEGEIRMWVEKVKTQSRDVFVGTVFAVRDSIVEGSPITAAPGQPVDTTNLKNSWQTDIQGDVGTIQTNVVYAPQIEDGVSWRGKPLTLRPLTLRSKVGGFHSVKLTRLGFDALVEHVTREVTRGRA